MGFQSGVLPLDALVTFRASLAATLRNFADDAVQPCTLALSRAADTQCGLRRDPSEAFGFPFTQLRGSQLMKLCGYIYIYIYVLALESASGGL